MPAPANVPASNIAPQCEPPEELLSGSGGECRVQLSQVSPAYDAPHIEQTLPRAMEDNSRLTRRVIQLIFDIVTIING